MPYGIEARLEWSPTVGKLAVRSIGCTALSGGDDVSPDGIARIALRDTVQTALETENLGGTGWPGLLEKHRDHDPLAADALIYLLAIAFKAPSQPRPWPSPAACHSPAARNESSPTARPDCSPTPNPASPPALDQPQSSSWDCPISCVSGRDMVG
jgi:hypothetical protein